MNFLHKTWVRRLGIGSLVLAVSLILLLWFVIFTNLGLRFSLAVFPRLAHTRITAESVEGTWYQGFKLTAVNFSNEDFMLKADGWSWTWAVKPEQRYLFTVGEINLGTIRFFGKNNPDKITHFPHSLSLPFKFKINSLKIADFYYGGQTEALWRDLEFGLDFDGSRYDLKMAELRLFAARVQGEIKIFSRKSPFPLAGVINFYDSGNPQQKLGDIKLSHNLQEPWVETAIKSEHLTLAGYVHLAPFDPIATRRITKAEIHGERINPNQLMSNWPRALVDWNLVVNASGITGENILLGSLTAVNAKAGYYAEQYLPIRAFALDFMIPENGTVELADGKIKTLFNKGIEGSGTINPDGGLQLSTQVELSLADFMNSPVKNLYSGTADLTGTLTVPFLRINVDSPMNKLLIEAQFDNRYKQLIFKKFLLSKQQNYISGAGTFFLRDRLALNLNIKAKNFNPESIFPGSLPGKINGNIQVKGNIQDNMAFMLDIKDSLLAGEPLTAQGFIFFNSKRLSQADFNLTLGVNHLALKGTPEHPEDEFLLDLKMPDIAQFGFNFSGAAYANARIQGTFKHLKAKVAGNFNRVVIPNFLRLDALDFAVDLSPVLTAPLTVKLQGSGLNYKNTVAVNNINSLFTGTLARHSGKTAFDLIYNKRKFTGIYEAAGGVNQDQLWTGTVNKLNLSGYTDITLHRPVQVKVSTTELSIGAAQWSILHGLINLNYFSWVQGQGLKTKGTAAGINLGELQPLFTLPVIQNIVLKGDWLINYERNASGYIRLSREAGSMIFSNRKTDLGLDKFNLDAEFSGGLIKARTEINTRFGGAEGELTIAQNFGDKILQAPLNGELVFSSHNIDNFKYTLPVGINLKGLIEGKIGIAGTFGNPDLNGYIRGNQIEYRDLNNGVFLKNGKLTSKLSNQQWLIENLSFHNPDGDLMLNGMVGRINRRLHLDLNLALNHYQIINQPNRLFIISGTAKLANDTAGSLNITGNLSLDKGRYENLGDNAPDLSADVYVLGNPPASKVSLWPLAVNVAMDLNNQFRFILADLNFLLGGHVRFISQKGEALKVFGKLTAVEGKYRAYGQNLHVSEGSLTFTGDPKNALMNVKAERYQSPVGAGINVIGTLLDPKVTLSANQPLSEQQKLSWLILGRESQGDNDNETLALAAGILAAEKVNKEAGVLLDNIGLSSRKTRNLNTGELNPAEQMVTLGKQINHNLYVGYEFGIQSATQAVRLIYVISSKLSVFGRFETDSSSGGVKYKLRFD